MIQPNTVDQTIIREQISSSLVMAANALKPMQIDTIAEDDFASLRPSIHAGFCYQNSLVSAIQLGARGVVLGAALVSIGPHTWPVEHAWVWLDDDRYCDPTYQLLNEQSDAQSGCLYYGLIHVTLDEYLNMATRVGKNGCHYLAQDVLYFRRSEQYRHLFKITTMSDATA